MISETHEWEDNTTCLWLSNPDRRGLGLVCLLGPGALIFYLLRKSRINSLAAPNPYKVRTTGGLRKSDILWQLLGSYQASNVLSYHL